MSGEESFMTVHVRRGHVLEDGLSELLETDPDEWRSSLKVTFVGESGIDTGGLSREFFTLLYSSLAESSLVSGKPPMLTLSHIQALLESGKYEALGWALSLALLGGFHVPQFFSKSLVNFILQRKDTRDSESLIAEFPDSMPVLKDKLLAIQKSSEIGVFNEIVSPANFPEIYEIGYRKKVEFFNKADIIHEVFQHSQVSSCLEEVQSLLKGLSRHTHCAVIVAGKSRRGMPIIQYPNTAAARNVGSLQARVVFRGLKQASEGG